MRGRTDRHRRTDPHAELERDGTCLRIMQAAFATGEPSLVSVAESVGVDQEVVVWALLHHELQLVVDHPLDMELFDYFEGDGAFVASITH